MRWHGELVPAIEADDAGARQADLARAPGRRADGPGRGLASRDRAEDPPDRRRRPQRPQGIVLAALVLGVPVEELVYIGVVDAGEAAGRQRGQDVRVRASRRTRV